MHSCLPSQNSGFQLLRPPRTNMQTNIDPLAPPTKAPRAYGHTPEYRLLRCNDSPLTTWICDTPERVANFWTSVIQGPDFDRDTEIDGAPGF